MEKKIGDAVFRVGDRRQFGQLCTIGRRKTKKTGFLFRNHDFYILSLNSIFIATQTKFYLNSQFHKDIQQKEKRF